MTTDPIITIDICPGQDGQPPMVRVSASQRAFDPDATQATIKGTGDTALVARTMLSAAAYLFTQGQPVQFGPEVPVEVLK